MSKLFDTHCHIHEMVRKVTPVYDKWHENGNKPDPNQVIADAHQAGVGYLLCVGTTVADSELAIEFVAKRKNIWASIGIHPHEAAEHLEGRGLRDLATLAHDAVKHKIVAIGECGLDYFYGHSPREDQIKVLKFQIELALAADLPMVFHVRDAFDDFWPIFESYQGIRGVLHSFTDSPENLQRAIKHGLYIGVNGIATFVKDPKALVTYVTIPDNLLLMETDAPFLTPAPYRGTMCEPKHVAVTAEFVSKLRNQSLKQTTAATTTNAFQLFGMAK